MFCGFGEPLKRLDCVLEVCRWIKRYYGKSTILRIDTNGQGYLINKGREIIEQLKEAGIAKVSVSLNAHDNATYNEICKPSFSNALESVLDFVKKTKKHSTLKLQQ